MLTKRRNQIRRIEEALIKESISENKEAEEGIRKTKEDELRNLLETIRICSEEEENIHDAYRRWVDGGRMKGVKGLLEMTKTKCDEKEKARCKERYKREKEAQVGGKKGAWKVLKGGASHGGEEKGRDDNCQAKEDDAGSFGVLEVHSQPGKKH